MAEFTVIETQEQFDNAIKARLDREKNKYTEQLNGYEELKTQFEDAQKQISDLSAALQSANDKASSFDEQIAERDSKIQAYEMASVKTKIANEMGLSFDAIDFLQGSDEESIRKSAESLKNLVGSKVAPLAAPEPIVAVSEDAERKADLKQMLNTIRRGE